MSKFSLGVWNHGPALADHICYVSPTFNYSEGLRQFSKIQDAIDWIYNESGWYADLGEFNLALVVVLPGVYEEQVESYNYIRIKGIQSTDLREAQGVTLYNTGADASTYPLSNDHLNHETYLEGITIKTDSGGTYGMMDYYSFEQCAFSQGCFVETDQTCIQRMDFKACWFHSTLFNHFDLTGVSPNTARYLSFSNMVFHRGYMKLLSSLNLSLPAHYNTVRFVDCEMKRGWLDIGGNADIRLNRVHSYELGRHEFSTSGYVRIQSSILSNGIRFTAAPSQLSVHRTSFIDMKGSFIPTGEADIVSTVPILAADYTGNTQDHGLSGVISIRNSPKNVGAGSLDRYFSIQDAVSSIQAGEIGIVRIHESFVNIPEIVPSDPSANVTIEGFGSFGLSFTGDIIEVGASGRIIFKSIKSVNGAEIHLNGVGAEVSIQDCKDFTAHVKADVGSSFELSNSTLTGSTGCPAITVNNTSTNFNIGYSLCKGAATQPAVLFTVDADNRLKTKFCTYVHGSGGGNNPLMRTGTFTVLFSAYSCAGNTRLDAPPGFTNVIVSGNNTIDTSINF